MTVSTAAPPVHGPSSPASSTFRGGVGAVGLAAAAALAAAAGLYGPVSTRLARQWYEDPDAAYGALVAVAAAIAIRRRWPRVRALPIHGSWYGAAALAAAALLYAIATLAADVFLLRVSLVLHGAAALWFVCGTAHLRALAVPLVLLLVAIPLPGAVVTELTMPLQLAASQCATALLQFAGVHVVRDGNVLALDHVTLEVAEACSGMRSLVTLLALVAVYWGTAGVAVRRVVLLAAATIPVALAGNGLRVAVTAALASTIGERATKGFIHDATGFAAFVVMCGGLVVVHQAACRFARVREAA